MMYILYTLIWIDGEVVEKDMGLPYFESYEECLQAGIDTHAEGEPFFCLDEVVGGDKI